MSPHFRPLLELKTISVTSLLYFTSGYVEDRIDPPSCPSLNVPHNFRQLNISDMYLSERPAASEVARCDSCILGTFNVHVVRLNNYSRSVWHHLSVRWYVVVMKGVNNCYLYYHSLQ